MKVLENRTEDSKREMEILDALQDLRARNARLERMAAGDSALDALEDRDEVLDEEALRKKVEEEEDEEIVRRVFSKVTGPSALTFDGTSSLTSSTTGGPDDNSTSSNTHPSTSSPSITIKRKADFLEPQLDFAIKNAVKAVMPKAPPTKKKKSELGSALGIKRAAKPKAPA